MVFGRLNLKVGEDRHLVIGVDELGDLNLRPPNRRRCPGAARGEISSHGPGGVDEPHVFFGQPTGSPAASSSAGESQTPSILREPRAGVLPPKYRAGEQGGLERVQGELDVEPVVALWTSTSATRTTSM